MPENVRRNDKAPAVAGTESGCFEILATFLDSLRP